MTRLPLALDDKSRVYRVVLSANATIRRFLQSDGLLQTLVYKPSDCSDGQYRRLASKTNPTGTLDHRWAIVLIGQELFDTHARRYDAMSKNQKKEEALDSATETGNPAKAKAQFVIDFKEGPIVAKVWLCDGAEGTKFLKYSLPRYYQAQTGKWIDRKDYFGRN